jgi:hypothetical protein
LVHNQTGAHQGPQHTNITIVDIAMGWYDEAVQELDNARHQPPRT